MDDVCDRIADLRLRRDGVARRLLAMSQAERSGEEWERLQRALSSFDAEIVVLEEALEDDK